MKPIILLFFLSSCNDLTSYDRALQVPYIKKKDCVFHNHQELPPCMNYNFLPMAKEVKREIIYKDYGGNMGGYSNV